MLLLASCIFFIFYIMFYSVISLRFPSSLSLLILLYSADKNMIISKWLAGLDACCIALASFRDGFNNRSEKDLTVYIGATHSEPKEFERITVQR